MANAAVRLDFNKALDVQCDVTTQVTLNDDVGLVDIITDLGFFLAGQVFDAGIGVDASGSQNLVRSGAADSVNVGETYLNPLLAGQVNAGNTCHNNFLQK